MKVKLWVAFFLLMAISAWAGKWTVDSFDNSPDPGDPDEFIVPESGSGLKPVKPAQVTQGGGRFYVRQKFEDTFGDEEAVYQLFQGKQTDAAKSLGKISLDGIPYQTLIKMKLFYSRNASGDDDLENVYYDGKDIFVEGEDPVYMNLNGKMEELKPSVSREFKISVTSDPPGATVTVGGSNKGSTPVTFTATSSKIITLVISKDDYYTVIKPITPSEKKVTQEGFLLTERKKLENPAAAFRTKLQTALSSRDANALKKIKSDIQQALKNYNSDSKKAIDGIISKMPANPPKASSESSGDFTARENLWKNTQAKEKDALNKDALNYFNELKELSADADAAGADLDFNLRYEYIPNSALTFSKWGPKDVSISAKVNNSRVKFETSNARVGYGSLPRSEVEDYEEDIHGVLKIWDTPNESGKFASIYDIAFFVDETPLQLLNKGSVSLSEATSSSRKTESDLNSRVKKMSGKAAWDKKDEAATIDALRKGSSAMPPPAPKKAPPPVAADDDDDDAYYDEDEDDEEFEEEMDNQKKRDYARNNAATSAADIFGNTDEYLFWTGMVFAAAAIGTGVFGFLENQKFIEADNALKATEKEMSNARQKIRDACNASAMTDKESCIRNAEDVAWTEGAKDKDGQSLDVLWQLNQYKTKNQTTKDSFNKSRIIFFGSAGLSAVISITLFLW
ncbi:MAG: PEGA domain-containing protein [Fibromonadales bacterium]|nr:PEGA domain-containing protein [Fibromonadales bacterium]